MLSDLNLPDAHCSTPHFKLSIFLGLFLFLLSGSFTALLAQGETACTAVAVQPGTYIADGPSTGGGALQGCVFDSTNLATDADWYRYTPVVDGTISVSSCLGGADTRLSIFSGFCFFLPPFGTSFSGSCIAGNDDACLISESSPFEYASEVVDVPVTAGTTYYIQWDNWWSTAGFTWTLDFTPYNDEPCDNDLSINISCGDTLQGSTYGATESGVTVSGCTFGSQRDVFYRISPLAVGATYKVDIIADSDIDPVLSAYNGSCSGATELLGCSDNIGNGVDESITFTSAGNNVIWIRVYDYLSTGGNFSIALTCIADECTNAIPLETDGTVINSDNSESTGSDYDYTCSSPAANNDIWFEFTTPGSGEVTIETHAGTIIDTKIQIWDDCPATGEVIACDDFSGVGLLSKVVWDCGSYLPNHTYYIQADSWSNSTTGTFGISVDVETECEAPENDLCADAISLDINAAPTNGNNAAATGSPGISIDCGFGSDQSSTNDVWYYFIAPASGEITIETFSGILTDTQLQILDACGGNVIACDEDSGNSLMSEITLGCDSYTPGNTYLVQVDGWSGAEGSFSISVSSDPCPVPNNNICANAEELTVHDQDDCAGNEVTGTTSGATSSGLAVNCEPGNPDVFYSFNSGDNTSVNINLEPVTSTDLVITVFENSCAGTQVLCSGNNGLYSLEVTPDTDYIVRVSTNPSFGDFGSFTICIEDGYDCFDLQANIGDACDDGNPLTENDVLIEGCTCQGSPANDECSDATSLVVHAPGDCSGNETTGTTTGANASGATLDACENESPDVFYSFNSGSTYNTIRITLNAIDATDLVLSIFENDCSSSAFYCNVGTNQTYDLSVDPGTTYIVRVHSLTTLDAGTFEICAEGVYDCPALSANIGDACDDGDPATENDVITESCACEGETIAYASVSGTVADWNSSCSSRDMEVSMYSPGTGTYYSNMPGTLDPDGSFTLNGSPDLLPGTYSVLIKVDGALAKVKLSVSISAGTNSVSFSSLDMGDINNDNFINISDVSQLNASFGLSAGDTGYNQLADLNCDGTVNIVDISILNSGYGQQGDILFIL